jgi:hypothetical protein
MRRNFVIHAGHVILLGQWNKLDWNEVDISLNWGIRETGKLPAQDPVGRSRRWGNKIGVRKVGYEVGGGCNWPEIVTKDALCTRSIEPSGSVTSTFVTWRPILDEVQKWWSFSLGNIFQPPIQPLSWIQLFFSTFCFLEPKTPKKKNLSILCN